MFNLEDFSVFNDSTLEGRLNKIRKIIDPKFEIIGNKIIDLNQPESKEQLYLHIAKHIRRHKNPPPDTWLAISTNKRGYKNYPHLELGFWTDCIFETISFLDGISDRNQIVEILKKYVSFDEELMITSDHTDSKMVPLTPETFLQATTRYLSVKSSDLVIGYQYLKNDFDEEVINQNIIKNSRTLSLLLNKYEQ